MVQVIIFIVLLLILSVLLLGLIINGSVSAIRHFKKKENHKSVTRLKKSAVVFMAVSVVCIVFIWITQFIASTPPIRDESGHIISESIAELRRVELNGRKEWISIRGYNKNNPVLLFLAGGPGGTQMAAVRYDLSELEKYFVVVNWDQAGSGKSFGAIKTKDIAVDTYIEDGYELTKYLCEEFRQKKIYLVGESWGSALGIFMADKAPELYHAFIGTGQMVSFLDTEIIDYNQALEIARERNDSKKITELKKMVRRPITAKALP